MDLLLPATDGGVAAQAMVWTAALVVALFATRRNPDWRILAIGIGLLGYAFMAIRTIH